MAGYDNTERIHRLRREECELAEVLHGMLSPPAVGSCQQQNAQRSVAEEVDCLLLMAAGPSRLTVRLIVLSIMVPALDEITLASSMLHVETCVAHLWSELSILANRSSRDENLDAIAS